MLEKPDIGEAKIVDCLQGRYGIDVIELQFLPIGNDVNTAVYRVADNNHRPPFLKLRRGAFFEAAVAIPNLLQEHGSKHVIAPIPTLDRKLSAPLDPFTVTLFPFVDGKNGFEHPLTDAHWAELGATLGRLHDTEVPPDIGTQLPQETYAPKWRDMTRHILHRVEHETFKEPTAAKFAEFIRSKQETIHHLVDRAEVLSRALTDGGQPLVLCHGDIHAANVLTDADGRLYVVDWDTLVLAPKERDLMFIGAGIGGAWNRPEEARLFFEGYGPAEVHAPTLAYYRYERIVEDVVAFSDEILFTDKGGRDREKGLGKFKSAFLPNDVVDIAMREEGLHGS